MNSAITWFVKKDKDDNYSPSNDFYCGNINGNETTSIYIEVWNNYQGFNNIDNILDAKLIIRCLDIDDAYLFDYMKIKINNEYKALIKYDDTKYCVRIGDLYGTSNNGTRDGQNYLINKNLCNIEIILSEINYKIKNGIKNLIFDISE